MPVTAKAPRTPRNAQTPGRSAADERRWDSSPQRRRERRGRMRDGQGGRRGSCRVPACRTAVRPPDARHLPRGAFRSPGAALLRLPPLRRGAGATGVAPRTRQRPVGCRVLAAVRCKRKGRQSRQPLRSFPHLRESACIRPSQPERLLRRSRLCGSKPSLRSLAPLASWRFNRSHLPAPSVSSASALRATAGKLCLCGEDPVALSARPLRPLAVSAVKPQVRSLTMNHRLL
jgi:hypothetical protein